MAIWYDLINGEFVSSAGHIPLKQHLREAVAAHNTSGALKPKTFLDFELAEAIVVKRDNKTIQIAIDGIADRDYSGVGAVLERVRLNPRKPGEWESKIAHLAEKYGGRQEIKKWWQLSK